MALCLKRIVNECCVKFYRYFFVGQITAGPVPHMVRLTGATAAAYSSGRSVMATATGLHPGDRYHLLSKKGNQVPVTVIKMMKRWKLLGASSVGPYFGPLQPLVIPSAPTLGSAFFRYYFFKVSPSGCSQKSPAPQHSFGRAMSCHVSHFVKVNLKLEHTVCFYIF